jgi:hypothetical protein
VNRLVQPHLSSERGGGEHPDRARDHRRLVRENVAEEVRRDDHVELLRIPDELHGAVVDQHVGKRDVRELPLAHLRDDLSPQYGRLQDVRLVHGGHPPRSFPAKLEGDPGDPLDLRAGVNLRVDPRLDAVDHLDSPGLAEIDPPGELPHYQEIDSLHELPAEG